MKFGTFITRQRGEVIAADVRAAEQLGFESAWIAEHLDHARESDLGLSIHRRWPVPGAAGRALSRSAADARLRRRADHEDSPRHRHLRAAVRNAFVTAKAIATLDQLSQGRVIFGVGIGWLKEEFEAVGMKFEDRALRTREYLELMIELWSKTTRSTKARRFQLRG